MRDLKECTERVRELLPKEEILAQLAEECTELAQAALKYRRVLDGTNPTPVEEGPAIVNLYEEIGDVLGCLCTFGLIRLSDVDADLISVLKMERWVRRLEARDGAD